MTMQQDIDWLRETEATMCWSPTTGMVSDGIVEEFDCGECDPCQTAERLKRVLDAIDGGGWVRTIGNAMDGDTKTGDLKRYRHWVGPWKETTDEQG